MENQNRKAVNEVDVSAERVERDWEVLAIEEQIEGETEAEKEAIQGGRELDGEPEEERPAGAAENLAALLVAPLQVGFTLAAPEWRVTPDECRALAGAWGPVLAKYLPPSVLRWVPNVTGEGDGSACIECEAVAVTVQIIAPRLQTEEATQKEEGEQARKVQSQNQKDEGPAPMPDVFGSRTP